MKHSRYLDLLTLDLYLIKASLWRRDLITKYFNLDETYTKFDPQDNIFPIKHKTKGLDNQNISLINKLESSMLLDKIK